MCNFAPQIVQLEKAKRPESFHSDIAKYLKRATTSEITGIIH